MEMRNEQGMLDRLNDEDLIDLRQYWQTLMRYKWGIIGFTFVMTLLAVLVTFSLTPIYRATAVLLIESQEAKVVSIEEVYGIEGAQSEYFTTQFEILKSRKLAEKVVRELGLADHPSFNKVEESILPFGLADIKALVKTYLPAPMPEREVVERDPVQATADAFMAQLIIEPVRKSQLVRISFESEDRELAAKVANAVGEAYIDSNLEAKLELTLKASSWLSTRLESLRADLTAAEQRLQNYRESEKIIGERGGLDIAGQELELISNKLAEAQRERLAAESLYKQVQSIGRNNPQKLELVPTVLQHPLVQVMKQSYAQIELKRSEVAKRYGPKHPKMQAVTSELNNARRSLNSQILSIVNGIETDYKVALANEESLRNSLEGTKGDMQDLSRKEFKLRELQQDVDAKSAVFNTFLARFNETSATKDLNTANARIADPAVVPTEPVKPKKKLIVLMAAMGSFMLGVMFAFLLQALNNTVKTASEVENRLHAVMLGLLPLLPGGRKQQGQSYLEFVKNPQSQYAESLRTIRTGLMLSALDNPHKTISVTSTVAGEGKSTLALGIAFAMGQMERVLLIDADLRRPSIARSLGYERTLPGLSNLVAGTAEMEECIQHFGNGHIDVICAGVTPPNPSELLSSKRFKEVLAQLEGRYDRIIIDTAPSQAVSDALILAPLVGAMVYVVKSDSTPYQHARNGLKRLKAVNAPLVGVVLNQVDMKKGAKYYGQEYGGYYDVYGYTAQS